eukprot:1393444-Amorphochlora_amoeboformis.AAC.2
MAPGEIQQCHKAFRASHRRHLLPHASNNPHASVGFRKRTEVVTDSTLVLATPPLPAPSLRKAER